MEFSEIVILTCITAFVLLIGGIINVYTGLLGSWFATSLIIFYVVAVLLLRFGNRQGERKFLVSFLAQTFFQPKHIVPYGKNIRINKRS